MKKLNILVTGSGGGGHGQQIIKALKLSKLNFNLITTDVTEISVGKMVGDKFHVLPFASDPDYIQRLLKICKSEKIDVLFHGSEPELKKISKFRDIFINLGIYIPINSERVIDICMDKNKTVDFLSENNLNYPKSFKVSKGFDLSSIKDYPLVLKPSIGGGGSQFTFIAQNLKELKIYNDILLENFHTYLIQEYIGNYENEYTIGVLHDHQGRYVNSISTRRIIHSGLGTNIKVKNKTKKTELGEYLIISSGISQGYVSQDKLICDQAIEVADKLDSRGPLNLQCRLVNDKLYVFEVNPRFSGTSYIRALMGLNEPEIMISKYYGIECDEMTPLKEGFVMRRLEEFNIL